MNKIIYKFNYDLIINKKNKNFLTYFFISNYFKIINEKFQFFNYIIFFNIFNFN